MRVIVLCRFSVPSGKYFFKIDQQRLRSCLDREGVTTLSKGVVAIPALGWCCHSDFKQMLIKAIASCFETRSALSFCDQVIAIWHKEQAKALGWLLSGLPPTQDLSKSKLKALASAAP
jgi:hypothetical protein